MGQVVRTTSPQGASGDVSEAAGFIEDFNAVQQSSEHGRRKKKKNDAAAARLHEFLLARDVRKRESSWLQHQKNANPKLASQWVKYMERTRAARENIGPGSSFILMD